jgi:hypothetical protein
MAAMTSFRTVVLRPATTAQYGLLAEPSLVQAHGFMAPATSVATSIIVSIQNTATRVHCQTVARKLSLQSMWIREASKETKSETDVGMQPVINTN